MATKVEAARLLMLKAARMKDAGERSDVEAGMAKLFASETGKEVVEDSFRIHGGYGYSKEYEIERLYRDAPLLLIGEGTSRDPAHGHRPQADRAEPGMSAPRTASSTRCSARTARDAAQPARTGREPLHPRRDRRARSGAGRSSTASRRRSSTGTRPGPAAAARTWRAERFEAGDWPTVAIVRRQFGNMSKALFAADARPRRGPTRGRSHLLSDDEILDAIREWHRLYGEPPATSDWAPARARSGGQLWRLDRYYAGNWPSTNTVIRRFGTFTEAVRRAGLEPRPRGRHTSAGGKLPRDAREIIRRHLDAPRLTCGPAVLAARVRGVADARTADDLEALRGALVDLAAAALSWADVVAVNEPPLLRSAA